MTTLTGRASQLYQQVILEHYRRPRNRGTLAEATHEGRADNPVCGDEVLIQLRLRGGVIEAIAFSGRGCSISQAAASLMTDAIQGRTIAQAHVLARQFGGLMRGEASPADASALGELRHLSAVARFPMRVRCALLPWEALLSAGAVQV